MEHGSIPLGDYAFASAISRRTFAPTTFTEVNYLECCMRSSEVVKLTYGVSQATQTMWLLSTSRAELHFFPDAGAVDGGYAALSHTWGTYEQSFQEVQAIRTQCASTGQNPRDLVSAKIREFCILAEKDGYMWGWVDSCCIDKTSSTELSEAINSMFTWYSQAEICYAFLADVPRDCVLDSPGSAFRTSKWHTRGWTLQELIAPAIVVFLSKDWKLLGTKAQLAPLLSNITDISTAILTRETQYFQVSLAVRMSWASKRKTTRIEDEAYCLMGLFNVNMPTIYGEGRQAFHRLQLEIMKQTADTSLFAWGPWIPQGHLNHVTLHVWHEHDTHEFLDEMQYLLANSPAPFGHGTHYSPKLSHPLQPYLPYQWDVIHHVCHSLTPCILRDSCYLRR